MTTQTPKIIADEIIEKLEKYEDILPKESWGSVKEFVLKNYPEEGKLEYDMWRNGILITLKVKDKEELQAVAKSKLECWENEREFLINKIGDNSINNEWALKEYENRITELSSAIEKLKKVVEK